MKRFLLLVLTLCGLSTLAFAQDTTTNESEITPITNWSQVADTSWYDEVASVTAYTIMTPGQLAGLYELVELGVTFENQTITLGADIDLEQYEWTRIGYNTAFKGTFEGAGHTISNLKISGASTYQGLFGYTESATIQNLTLDNVDVKSNGYTGSLIGVGYSTTIKNCNVTGTVMITTTANYSGGLVGYLYGASLLEHCAMDGAITVKGSSYLGGMAGYVGGTSSVINCTIGLDEVSVTDLNVITTGNGAGGMVGYFNSNGRFDLCQMEDKITVRAAPECYYAGGMVGVMYNVTTDKITNCIIDGDLFVECGWFAGGLIGCLMSVDIAEISGCSVAGNITVQSVLENDATRASTAAGLFGTNQNTTLVDLIQDCHLSGTFRIYSAGSQTAGIISSGPIQKIIGCTVSGTNFEDGTQSYIRADTSQAAGIIGYQGSGYYSNLALVTQDCVVENVRISAGKHSAAGIAGYVIAGTTIQGCTLTDVHVESDWTDAKTSGILVGTHAGTRTKYPIKLYNNMYGEDTTLTYTRMGGENGLALRNPIAFYDYNIVPTSIGLFVGTGVTLDDAGDVTSGKFEVYDETTETNILSSGLWSRENTDGTHTVTDKKVLVGDVETDTITEAIALAKPTTETEPLAIELIASTDEEVAVLADKYVSIDLKGEVLKATTSAGDLHIYSSLYGGTVEAGVTASSGIVTLSGLYTKILGTLNGQPKQPVASPTSLSLKPLADIAGSEGFLVIQGGTYENDPTAYLVEGYTTIRDINNYYVVVPIGSDYPEDAIVTVWKLVDGVETYVMGFEDFSHVLDASVSMDATMTLKLHTPITLATDLNLKTLPGIFDLNGQTINTGEYYIGFLPSSAPLTLRNGTITGTLAAGGIVRVGGNKAVTIQGCKLTNTGEEHGVALALAPKANTTIADSAVTVTGGLQVASDAMLAISGGTYAVDPTPYLVEGYVAFNDVAGFVVAGPYAANIGSKYYKTFIEALAVAENNDTITLMLNTDLATEACPVYQGSGTLNLDLNGHTLVTSKTMAANIHFLNGYALTKGANEDITQHVTHYYSNLADVRAYMIQAQKEGKRSSCALFEPKTVLDADWMLPSGNATTSGFVVRSGYSVVVDLNGFILSQQSCGGLPYALFDVKGNTSLIIEDSSSDGTGEVVAAVGHNPIEPSTQYGSIIYGRGAGDILLMGGTFRLEENEYSASTAITLDGTTNFVVDGANIVADGRNNYAVILFTKNATFDLRSGTIVGKTAVVAPGVYKVAVPNIRYAVNAAYVVPEPAEGLMVVGGWVLRDVSEEDAVCAIKYDDGQVAYFDDLNTALYIAGEFGYPITLLADLTLDTIPDAPDNAVTIDINGCTLTSTYPLINVENIKFTNGYGWYMYRNEDYLTTDTFIVSPSLEALLEMAGTLVTNGNQPSVICLYNDFVVPYDITLPSTHTTSYFLVPTGYDVTVDLNGKTVTQEPCQGQPSGGVFTSYGTLTIVDNSEAQKGTVVGTHSIGYGEDPTTYYQGGLAVWTVAGTTTLKSGTFTATEANPKLAKDSDMGVIRTELKGAYLILDGATVIGVNACAVKIFGGDFTYASGILTVDNAEDTTSVWNRTGTVTLNAVPIAGMVKTDTGETTVNVAGVQYIGTKPAVAETLATYTVKGINWVLEKGVATNFGITLDGGVPVTYPTLAAALNAVTAEANVVTLLTDTTEEAAIKAAIETYTVDGDGKTVTLTNPWTLGAATTLKNISIAQDAAIEGTSLVVPAGTALTAEGENTIAAGLSGTTLKIDGSGTLTVSGELATTTLTIGTTTTVSANAITATTLIFAGELPTATGGDDTEQHYLLPTKTETLTASVAWSRTGETLRPVTATASMAGTEITLPLPPGPVTIEAKLDEAGEVTGEYVPVLDIAAGLETLPENGVLTTPEDADHPELSNQPVAAVTVDETTGKKTFEVTDAALVIAGADVSIKTQTGMIDEAGTVGIEVTEAQHETMELLNAKYEVDETEGIKLSYVYDFGIHGMEIEQVTDAQGQAHIALKRIEIGLHEGEGEAVVARTITLEHATLEVHCDRIDGTSPCILSIEQPTFVDGLLVWPPLGAEETIYIDALLTGATGVSKVSIKLVPYVAP